MMELRLYNDKEHESVLRNYYSRKDLDRYTNKGKYHVLSLFGVYHSDFYVLCDNGTVVGCILVRTKFSKACKKESWIYDVIILREARGRGYSNILLKLALDKCRRRPVRLYVSKQNVVAINLYKKNGFVTESEKGNDLILRYDKV